MWLAESAESDAEIRGALGARGSGGREEQMWMRSFGRFFRHRRLSKQPNNNLLKGLYSDDKYGAV
jgi:hypothetical protein